jgi:hypothetical protein
MDRPFHSHLSEDHRAAVLCRARDAVSPATPWPRRGSSAFGRRAIRSVLRTSAATRNGIARALAGSIDQLRRLEAATDAGRSSHCARAARHGFENAEDAPWFLIFPVETRSSTIHTLSVSGRAKQRTLIDRASRKVGARHDGATAYEFIQRTTGHGGVTPKGAGQAVTAGQAPGIAPSPSPAG